MISLSKRRQLAQLPADFFDSNQPLQVTRAPGRLDVMSGAADYSGGLCIQKPLAEATWCALQTHAKNTITFLEISATVSRKQQTLLTIPSSELAHLSLGQFLQQGVHDFNTFRIIFSSLLTLRDAGYIHAEQIKNLGASLLLASEIPPRVGLASSGSIIVTSVLTWMHMFKITLSFHQLLSICAKICVTTQHKSDITLDGSNLSQVSAALLSKSQLFQFNPQTLEYLPFTLPDDMVLQGVICCKRHDNAQAIYRKARCATFMGRRILRDLVPYEMRASNGELHLANISVDVWRALRDRIPAKMRGSDFLKYYGNHEDERTHINPDDEYSIRLATEHPIYENARTQRFASLLQAAQNNPDAREALLTAAGDLMIQSHCSYDHRYALGSPETDLAVELCRKYGPRQGILGAKTSGIGAGGTVVILGDKQKNAHVEELIEDIAHEYETQSGKPIQLIEASSPGVPWSKDGACAMNIVDFEKVFLHQ